MNENIFYQIRSLNPDVNNPFDELVEFFKLIGKYFKDIKSFNRTQDKINFPIHWDLNKVSDAPGGYITSINEVDVKNKYGIEKELLNADKFIKIPSYPQLDLENVEKFILGKKNDKNIDNYGVSFQKLATIFYLNIGNSCTIESKLFSILKKCIVTLDNKIPKTEIIRRIILKIKDGKKEKTLDNIRPIIMQSTMIKILDFIIYERIKNFTRGKFDMTQKQLEDCGSKIEKSYVELFSHHNKNRVSIFFDFKNAYPSIHIKKMIDLLYSKKVIDEVSYNYILCSYNNPLMVYNNTQFFWNYGLMQGSSLSNILFILYQNEVFKEIFKNYFSMISSKNLECLVNKELFITQFVDDTRITLNKDKKNVKEFCEFFENSVLEFDLEINIQKTFYIGDYDLKYKNVKDIEHPKKYLGSHAYLMNENRSITILENNVERVISEISEMDWTDNVKIYFWKKNIKNFIDKEIYYIAMYLLIKKNNNECILNKLKELFLPIYIQEYEFFSEIGYINCDFNKYCDFRLFELSYKTLFSTNFPQDKKFNFDTQYKNIFEEFDEPKKEELKHITKKNKKYFQISNKNYSEDFFENEL